MLRSLCLLNHWKNLEERSSTTQSQSSRAERLGGRLIGAIVGSENVQYVIIAWSGAAEGKDEIEHRKRHAPSHNSQKC